MTGTETQTAPMAAPLPAGDAPPDPILAPLTKKEQEYLESHFGFDEDLLKETKKFITAIKKRQKKGYTSPYNLICGLATLISKRRLKSYGIETIEDPNDTNLISARLLFEKEGLKQPLIDHTRLFRYPDGRKIIVTSPYDVELPDLKKLAEFCDKYGFYCRIAGIEGETYFVGHTSDILLIPIENETEDEAVV